MYSAKNGVSAPEIERKYGLTPKTAWLVLRRIREAMRRAPLAGLLSGTVTADETWIGGQLKNRHRSNPREQPRAYATTDQTPVFALVHYETREVRSRAVPNAITKTLGAAIAEEMDRERTELWTDGATAYIPDGESMRGHQTVDHAARPVHAARRHDDEHGGEPLLAVEAVTRYHVSKEHLNRYLAQFDFLYSLRKTIDSAGSAR